MLEQSLEKQERFRKIFKMVKVALRKNNKIRRKLRVRKKVFGTTQRPRLSVYRSNKYLYGQIIDDTKGTTLVGLSLNDVKKIHKDKSKQDAAFEIGKTLAEKAKDKKIKTLVLDRGSYNYHGRVKYLADGAREGGLIL